MNWVSRKTGSEVPAEVHDAKSGTGKVIYKHSSASRTRVLAMDSGISLRLRLRVHKLATASSCAKLNRDPIASPHACVHSERCNLDGGYHDQMQNLAMLYVVCCVLVAVPWSVKRWISGVRCGDQGLSLVEILRVSAGVRHIHVVFEDTLSIHLITIHGLSDYGKLPSHLVVNTSFS